MNAVEFANVVRRTEHIESPSTGDFDAPRPPAPGKPRDARLRYAMLAGLALLSAWFVFTIASSISDIETELDSIRANVVLPLRK